MNGWYGPREEGKEAPPSILQRFEGGGLGSPTASPRTTVAMNFDAIQQLEAAVVGNGEHREKLAAQLDAEIEAVNSQLQRLKYLRQALAAMLRTKGEAEERPAGSLAGG